MERYGIICDELEMKGFLLFILRRFEGGTDLDTMLEVGLDRVSDYFDFMTALTDLLKSEHMLESLSGKGRWFTITPKGIRDAETLERSIPYSIRLHSMEDIERILSKKRRDDAIRASTAEEDGAFRTKLRLDADHSTVLELSLLFTDKKIASAAEENFKKHAEKIYSGILAALFDPHTEKLDSKKPQ